MSSCPKGNNDYDAASPEIQRLLDAGTRFVAVSGIGLLAPGDTGQLNDGGPSAARTAIGYNRSNDEMYVFQGGSYTPDQMQDLFRGLGADNAVLLDGGGSSAIVLRRDTGGMWSGAGSPRATAIPGRCCAIRTSARCPAGSPSTDQRCGRRSQSGARTRRRTARRAPAADTAGAADLRSCHPCDSGRDGLIAVEDIGQIRASEQREHRQVGLTVSAVCCRVDQYRAVRRPHDVSAPQVPVQPRWRVSGVEITCSTTLYNGRRHAAADGDRGAASSAIGANRSTA